MTAPTATPRASARVYYPMFDGVWSSERIHDLVMDLEIGGAVAHLATNYQVSIYGREDIDAPNLATIFRTVVERPAGATWVPLHVSRGGIEDIGVGEDDRVRCIVLKLEAMADDFTPPADPATKTYADQAGSADAPPWGVRVESASVYASSLGRNVTILRAIEDIVSPFFTVTVVGATAPLDLELDQMSFAEVPKSRAEALDDVNAMVGYSYFCWEDGELVLQAPGAGTQRTADVTDPRISFSFAENIDDTYNGVRVKYQNPYGHERDAVAHMDSPVLGATDKGDTIDAPDSVRSYKGAMKVGLRYLRDHIDTSISGTLHVEGVSESFGDALLARPGDLVTISGAGGVRHDLQATGVTLNVLDWSSDVRFDVAPARFDLWLNKVAAGAHARKR